MQEQPKMDLRPKRRPKYRGSDQQDPYNPGYNRPNYLKMNTTTLTQDYLSPSGQLNQSAKLLVKFMQKANKMYGEVKVGRQAGKREIKDKGVENGNEKKQSQSTKSQKVDAQKKEKEMYKFKEIHQNTELMKTLSQEQSLKGAKSYQNLSQLINNKGIYSGPLANQLSQLQSLYPHNEPQMHGQSQNPTLNSTQMTQKQPPSTKFTATKQKPQHKSKSLSKHKQKPVVQQSDSNGVKENRGDKLFKRSAYHVAIAYHIFMAKLKEEGSTSAEELDPTYRARVVREQAGSSGGRR